MNMEETQGAPVNDGLDREAAMMRDKTVMPLRDDIVPDDLPDSEIVAHHELSGAPANLQNDTESTVHDDMETFTKGSTSPIVAVVAVSAVAVGAVIFGYLGLFVGK